MRQITEKKGESFVACRGCVSTWSVWKIEKRRAIRSNRVCASLFERSIDSVENEIRCILVISVDVLKERRAATVLVHSPTIQVIPGIITVIKNNRVRGESSNSPDDI